MERFRWPVPSDEYIRQQLKEGDNSSIQYRVERYKFLWEEFGPPFDILLVGGIPSMFALNELQRSYVNGNFMATVLIAQAFIEQSLAGSYLIASEDYVVERGFAALIEAAMNDGHITTELADMLHRLRKMRNPYTHNIGGMGKRSYMRRLFEMELTDPEDLVVEDAKFSIKAVVDYLRLGSPDWNPENYQWSEENDV